MRQGIFDLYSTASYEAFKGCDDLKNEFLEEIGEFAWYLCKGLMQAKCDKKKRIRARFKQHILEGNTIFVTLTFSDEVLKNTSKETRHIYVARFLKKHCAYYVANLDYGKTTHREHYHALVKTHAGVYLSADDWQYGFSWFNLVPPTIEDSEAVSSYVAKLTNHALKTTGHMPRMIWSRGWKQYKDMRTTRWIADAIKRGNPYLVTNN